MSDDKVVDALLNFADAVENAALVLKQAISEKAEEEAPSWDPSRIKWVKTEGTRGEYERYPAEGEKPENTPDYMNMLEDLKNHNGKLTRDGLFYWLFQDKATVGRKKRKY